MTDSTSSAPTEHENLVEDTVDEFCYELAMALRRILGLTVPWADLDEEEDRSDSTCQPPADT